MNLKIIPIGVLIIIFFPMLIGVYTDYLWFVELGYVSAFFTMLNTKLLLLMGVTIFSFIVLISNLKLVERNLHKKFGFILLSSIMFALFIGLISMNSWPTVLRYFEQTGFGITDPIFNLDIGFYIFSLPFYFFLWNVAFSSLLVSGMFAVIIYVSPIFTQSRHEYATEPTRAKIKIFNNVKTKNHLLAIGGILLLLIGANLFLQRYSILNSNISTVSGAGYTDVNVVLPYLTAMSALLVLAGISFFVSTFMKKYNIATTTTWVIIAAVIIGAAAIGVVQFYKVVPDEFNYEKPFLEYGIQFTRSAYGIDTMKETEFPAARTLTSESLKNNKQTIDNIRLWDWRPMLATYKQLQLIRTYYDFNDADVDRYTFNGGYKQVIVSAREINSRLLPDKSWVNKNLVFTHGYGVTLSPVREVTQEGLPTLYVRDIPPISEVLEITRPEIYFGELTNEYVIVNTKTEELDYPKGDTNVYTTYSGKAGIPLTGTNRFLMTLKFGSPEILFSNSITPESKILFNRNIIERVSTLAPFLQFDRDPYVVVNDGKIYWIIDAYTVSNKYPYSQYFGGINYIRNSVKVVVDAYNGDTTFYVIDEEPIIKTYMKIFPDLFAAFDKMPNGLKSHIRYPVDLFTTQAEVYKTYHMYDPRVFYNKEDVWESPQELYERQKIIMEPYYLIMQLPGEEKEEFILLQPFTPKGKNNMIGWIAARNDFPNYGERIVFMFPKEKLVFGTMQIEARIDQDPEISQRFTLWDQIGTRVIRGNMLVIPIEDSLLYVEPIYLRATQEGSLPELKRVIVAYGDKLTMQETLDKSLGAIFGEIKEEPTKVETQTIKDLVSKALKHYNNAQELLKAGDWTGYGNELQELQETLEELVRRET